MLHQSGLQREIIRSHGHSLAESLGRSTTQSFARPWSQTYRWLRRLISQLLDRSDDQSLIGHRPIPCLVKTSIIICQTVGHMILRPPHRWCSHCCSIVRSRGVHITDCSIVRSLDCSTSQNLDSSKAQSSTHCSLNIWIVLLDPSIQRTRSHDRFAFERFPLRLSILIVPPSDRVVRLSLGRCTLTQYRLISCADPQGGG